MGQTCGFNTTSRQGYEATFPEISLRNAITTRKRRLLTSDFLHQVLSAYRRHQLVFFGEVGFC